MSLKLSGKDAFKFLKAQSSNEIQPEKLSYCAFLKNKAEIVSLTAIEVQDASNIIIYTHNPQELKDHLEKFIIIEDVSIESNSKEILDLNLEDFTSGQSLIKLEENHPGIIEKYISFTKGCFPGQEVLSKYKNIGLKKKEERSKRYTDEALEIFAQAKNNQEALEPAIELLQKALKENPKNEDAYESLGVMLAKQEKFQKAIAVMQQLEMINPQNPMALMNLSIFYMKLGDKETAEDYKAKATVLEFEKALKK